MALLKGFVFHGLSCQGDRKSDFETAKKAGIKLIGLLKSAAIQERRSGELGGKGHVIFACSRDKLNCSLTSRQHFF